MKSLRFGVAGCVLALAAGSASADIITHFGSGAGGAVIDNLLDQVGIGSGNPGSENAATLFTVPGNPGDPVNVQFRFLWDTGSFEFDFGFANVAGIPFDPVTQRALWAAAALSPARATLVFSDPVDNPTIDSPVFSLTGGDQLTFFIIPNNRLAAFQAAPAAFYLDATGHGNGDDTLRSPLFSQTGANPGDLDQMLSFAGNGATMFAFEDLTRTEGSDQNFADLVFSVNSEIVPAPSSLALLACFGIAARGRRRR